MSEIDDLEDTLAVTGWTVTNRRGKKANVGRKKEYPSKAAKSAARRARYVAKCAADPEFVERERKSSRERQSAKRRDDPEFRELYNKAARERMRARRAASTVASKPPHSEITDKD